MRRSLQSQQHLIILERGEPIRLIKPNGDMRLGREDVEIRSDITLKSPIVSRNHATLKRSGNRWLITDNGSMNGVIVNKEVISGERFLDPFDVIRIADKTLVFTGKEIIYNDVQSSPSETSGFCYDERQTIMSVNIARV